MLPSPFLLSSEQRQKRSLTQDVIPFLHNLIFQYTNPLSLETEPHSKHTIPLIREHYDSYLYYFRYKTLENTHSQTPFQIIFNPINNINTGTYYRTIHPQNIIISIQDVFMDKHMDKHIEHNENLDTPLYLPSHLENLKEQHEYFEVPDLETKIQRHNNPHYWLQQDNAQIEHSQYRFFQNIILDDDTVPQIKIFSHFLVKFFRFNYQLLWEQQDQNAYIHFPQVLTELELLPYVRNEANKHLHYRDPTSLNISHLELIILDNQFLVENSEVSDNRPSTSTNINPEILSEQFDSNNLQQDSKQDFFLFRR